MQYKCKYLKGMGYVVYRHHGDLTCTDEEHAQAHKVAVFICKSEALDYCAYRNEMMQKYGTDSVDAIERAKEN